MSRTLNTTRMKTQPIYNQGMIYGIYLSTSPVMCSARKVFQCWTLCAMPFMNMLRPSQVLLPELCFKLSNSVNLCHDEWWYKTVVLNSFAWVFHTIYIQMCNEASILILMWISVLVLVGILYTITMLVINYKLLTVNLQKES